MFAEGTPHANLSQAMCFLTGRYSRDLNRRFEWDGPLFRARYKNRVVEDEDYWRDLLAYIHLNPVKAGLATSPDNADWTSHQAYTGLGPGPASQPGVLTVVPMAKVPWLRVEASPRVAATSRSAR